MYGSESTPVLPRYAALYIDVPNIQTRGQGPRKRYVPQHQLDWARLVSTMLASLETDRYTYVGTAYLFCKNRSFMRQREEELRQALLPHQASMSVVGAQEDIDARLIIDMWADGIALAAEMGRKGSPFPQELTILLASGDHIYGEAVQRMRETLEGRVTFRLHTFSWASNLSRVLAASSERVSTLDADPLLIAGTAIR